MSDDLTLDEHRERHLQSLNDGRPSVMIYREEDGNWRGIMTRGERGFVQAREVGPETVLQKLLTHDGK